MKLIGKVVMFAWFLLNSVLTYCWGTDWIRIITTQLGSLTIATIALAIIYPVLIFVIWIIWFLVSLFAS